jgi:NAD(P)-dependent dehydrogenase (short-subunit alcohol dehydrogenase family)
MEEALMPQAPNTIALAPGTRVLVTAGGSGIGRAIADLLLAHGARAHICDVSDEFLADFAEAWPDAGRSKTDVSSEAEVARMFEDVRAGLGGLDVLVNNAGIAGPTGGVEDISPADWRRTIDVCLTGQFLCAHFAVPMLKAGRGGSIVNLSSAAGRFGYAYRTPYSAAKWGVIGFTQSLAKELGPANIRVNAILPGIVEGPRMSRVIEARAEQVGVSYAQMEKTYVDRVSLKRMVTAEDVAATVLFLVSEAGRNLSGQSIGVDGNVESL